MKQLAQTFKALSDETRLRIVTLLTQGELCVCDLIAVLQLPQSTVSRHLAYLRNSGLVLGRREGVWMYYRLNDCPNIFQEQVWSDLLKELLKQKQSDNDIVKLNLHKLEKSDSRCG